MFIKDCTILYTATVRAATVLQRLPYLFCGPIAGADFQEIYSEIHIWRGLCSSAPSSSAYGARHPGPTLRQQPQQPKTPAISNRNAIRCTSTV